MTSRPDRYPIRIAAAALAASALMLLSVAAAPAATSPLGSPGAGVGGHSPGALEWDDSSLREIYNPDGRFYTYAPSVVREGATEWIWSCHNDESGVIKDHIYLTRLVDGAVQESRSVLQASPAPAWDSFHVCDPSVVAGNFNYDGTQYRYAMFYLGNDLDASAHNQVGVAFATDPEGPWTKYPEPLVTFDRTDQWGVGQPSAVSLAGKSGKILLAYTRGDTSTRAYVQSLDLSHMDRLRVGDPVLLPTEGLTGHDGALDYLNGYDIALDRTGHRVYTVREQHPYPQDNPWWIGPSVQVNSIGTAELLKGDGAWRVEGDINESLTGFTRNHNADLVRTWTGSLPERDSLSVVFTDSCSSLPTVDDPDWSTATCDSLFSYDLWEIEGSIE